MNNNRGHLVGQLTRFYNKLLIAYHWEIASASPSVAAQNARIWSVHVLAYILMHYLHLCQHVSIFKIYLSTANFRDLRARAQRWRWKSGESCTAKTKLLLAVADQGCRWGPVHVFNQCLEATSSVLDTRHIPYWSIAVKNINCKLATRYIWFPLPNKIYSHFTRWEKLNIHGKWKCAKTFKTHLSRRGAVNPYLSNDCSFTLGSKF